MGLVVFLWEGFVFDPLCSWNLSQNLFGGEHSLFYILITMLQYLPPTHQSKALFSQKPSVTQADRCRHSIYSIWPSNKAVRSRYVTTWTNMCTVQLESEISDTWNPGGTSKNRLCRTVQTCHVSQWNHCAFALSTITVQTFDERIGYC